MISRNIKNKIPSSSSRAVKNNSIPLLIKKVNSEINVRKKVIIKYPTFEQELPDFHNKFIFKRIQSSSNLISSESILKDNKFHENIYQDVNSLNSYFKNNAIEIKQMIKERKFNNFRKIYNMFFNGHFSNEYFNDFNSMKKRKFYFPKRNNSFRQIRRNNSLPDLINSKSRLIKNIKNDSFTPKLSANSSKIINTHISNNKSINIINTQISKKQLKYNNSNISATTNESLFTNNLPDIRPNLNIGINEDSITNSQNNIILPKFPNLQAQNSSITESDNLFPDNLKNKSSFLTDISTIKIQYNINKLRLNNTKRIEKIDKYEEKILKLKVFQTYQREYLEKLLKNEKYRVHEKIDSIINMFKEHEKIYKDYLLNINEYIKFILNTSKEIEIEFRMINQNKRDIKYEMENLCDKIIDKQKEFEYLINIRNFLFFVKNRGKNIIKLNNEFVYKVAKRKILFEKLFDIFGRTEESCAYKNLRRLIPIKQLEKIATVKSAKAKIITRLANVIRNTLSKRESDKNILMPPPPGEKIFQTPEEFIKILNDMTNNDINLLYDYQKIQLEKDELQNKLNEAILSKEELEKSNSFIYLLEGSQYLKEIKQKNIKLSKQYEHINNLLNKKKELSSLKLDFKIYTFKAFNNIYYFDVIKYNRLRVEYKLEGLVLLEKLIYNINQIISINNLCGVFDKDDIYHYVPQNILEPILMLKKEYFNMENKYLINEYTLNLIKLYEFFGHYIINKNIEDKKRNIELYNKVRSKIINERQIFNSNLLKKMLAEKRETSINELIERWNKKIIKIKNKNDAIIKYNLNKRLDDKNNNHNLKEKDDEFNDNNSHHKE